MFLVFLPHALLLKNYAVDRVLENPSIELYVIKKPNLFGNVLIPIGFEFYEWIFWSEYTPFNWINLKILHISPDMVKICMLWSLAAVLMSFL